MLQLSPWRAPGSLGQSLHCIQVSVSKPPASGFIICCCLALVAQPLLLSPCCSAPVARPLLLSICCSARSLSVLPVADDITPSSLSMLSSGLRHVANLFCGILLHRIISTYSFASDTVASTAYLGCPRSCHMTMLKTACMIDTQFLLWRRGVCVWVWHVQVGGSA